MGPNGRPDERTVLIVDDHRTFAEMLALALEGVPGLRCLGTAPTAAEGVALAARLHPDVVVMDIQLAREDGLVATRRILGASPETLVAVLTAHASAEWVSRAAQTGASAFIAKGGSLEEMIGLLAGMQRGQMLVAQSAFAPASGGEELSAGPELSHREIEVLRRLAAGVSVSQMAPELGITLNTCRSYVKAVRSKLGANSQLEAVLKARQLGLIGDEPPAPPR